jgi:endo-1,3(4)-beta-glucanase
MAFVTAFNETFTNLNNWVVLSAANNSANGYPGGPYQFGTDEIETMTAEPANLGFGSGGLRITPTRNAQGAWFSARIETARCFKPAVGSQMRVESRLQLPNIHGDAARGYWPAFWMMGSWQRDDRWIWPACFEFDIAETVNAVNRNWSVVHGGPRSLWGGPFNEPEGVSNGGIAPASGNIWGEYHTYAMEWDRTTATDTIRFYVDGNLVHTVQPGVISPTDWNATATQPGFFLILNVAMGGQFPAKMGGGPDAATVPGASLLVEYVRVSYDGTEAAEAVTGNDGRGGTTTPPPDPEEPPPPPTEPPPATAMRSPIATTLPGYTTGTSYYPVDPNRTTLTGPFPTNAWFENWLVGTGQQPITIFPYELKLTTSGLDMCVPNLNTSYPQAVLATMLQNFSFRSTATFTSQKLTAFTDLGCTLQWLGGGGSMTCNIVRGMAYVTANYIGITPLLNTQNAILSINGTAVGATGSFSGSKFKMVLNNGQTWILYSSSAISLNLSTANTLTATGIFTGSLRLAYLPTAGAETQLDSSAACIPTGGSADFNISGNTAIQTYTFTSVGSGTLLSYCMLHHRDWLVSPTYPGWDLAPTLRGPMRAILGSTWTMSIPLSTPGWNNANPIASNRLSAIQTALAADKSFVPQVNDPYFGGKQLAKSARLVLIADQIGDFAARDTLLGTLRTTLTQYITGQLTCVLRYDTVWGGIVSAAGLLSQDADFGNGRYNDHHFHYGYPVYAAAVVAKFDTGWATTHRSRINDLIRDFANPSFGNADPYFTPMRNFDWFESHSWAAGNFEFGDNRNQESTSEAINAWYGVYLWGLVTGQPQIRDLGRGLFSQEVHTSQKYWQIKQSDIVYPEPFNNHGVIGILWSNKVDVATFFGAQYEYIIGIQMLPITPASEQLLPDAWISEVWPNNMLPLWSRTSVWRAELLNGGSGYVPQQTSQTGQGFSNGLVASGGTGSGLGFNVNITNGQLVGVYIIFDQHGSGYTDGETITLNGSGGTGAQVRVWTQPEDGWKGVMLGALAQIDPDQAWTRTQALTGFDDGSSKTQALVHIATQQESSTGLEGSARSVSFTTGSLTLVGGTQVHTLTGQARSISSTTGALLLRGPMAGSALSVSFGSGALVIVGAPPDPDPENPPVDPPLPPTPRPPGHHVQHWRPVIKAQGVFELTQNQVDEIRVRFSAGEDPDKLQMEFRIPASFMRLLIDYLRK